MPDIHTYAWLSSIISSRHPLGLENVFCWFLTKTKQNQALPRHFDGEIWPHSTQFWLWLFSISTFFCLSQSFLSPTIYFVSHNHVFVSLHVYVHNHMYLCLCRRLPCTDRLLAVRAHSSPWKKGPEYAPCSDVLSTRVYILFSRVGSLEYASCL